MAVNIRAGLDYAVKLFGIALVTSVVLCVIWPPTSIADYFGQNFNDALLVGLFVMFLLAKPWRREAWQRRK